MSNPTEPPSPEALALEVIEIGPHKSEDPNWRMVRNALAAMAEQQASFIRELRANRRIDSLFLIERFDDIDRALVRQTRAIELQTDLMELLNGIVAGVRSASDSNYDMVTSATRKIERIRKFLQVPDAIAEDPESPASTGQEPG